MWACHLFPRLIPENAQQGGNSWFDAVYLRASLNVAAERAARYEDTVASSAAGWN